MASCSCIIYTLLLLFLCLALAKNTTSSSSSLSDDSEREALVRTGWWGNQIPLCNWIGIYCSEAGRVVSIELGEYRYSNSIKYYIGDELGKLNLSCFPYLQTLDLSYCWLNGSIPYQIGMLSKLKYLSLRGNNLSGKLPSSLGNLTYLEHLDVSQNYLTGFVPSELGNLSNLEYLYLQYNKLTGTIPSALVSLTKAHCERYSTFGVRG